ncbi:MAG: efflux RND transporter permease subunit [Thermoguttaceae bacterium]
MTTSQFFVYRRPIAWTALVATLAWGVFAYTSMPQRHDPDITVGVAVVITPYPGARAEEVEQELTRKIEKKVNENPVVQHVRSISRQGLSVVFVELRDETKQADPIWEDLQTKLQSMGDLPRVNGQPVQPRLNKDFGDTASVMLTISSPPVSDFEVQRRAESIEAALGEARGKRPAELRGNRATAVLVYPTTVARSYVLWIGNNLRERLLARGLAEDVVMVEPLSTGCLDFHVPVDRTIEEVRREILAWRRDTIGTGMTHPDIWPGVLIENLDEIAGALRRSPSDPGRTVERYSYRELRQFADMIQDRLKQSPNVGKVEAIGVQEEAIYLYYSGRRFSAFGLSLEDIAERLRRRNINLPGGRVELADQHLVVEPSGEFRSEEEIGQVVVDVQNGYPVYLRDLVDVVRGYEDPPNVMNLRTVKTDARQPRTARLPGDPPPQPVDSGERRAGSAGSSASQLQTTRAITLSIRQVKGVQVADFGRDIDEALASLREVLPDDLQIERTSNEPQVVREKIGDFNRNLLEAIGIVVVVALLFMEWRSALLVAFSIPLTVAMTLGMCHLAGVDLQQVSIAALIIALGLLVDDPVVAGDAINRELAHGQPRDVAAWLGPQKLARAILFATLTNCVAFLPLLLVTGKTGEFIWSLPVVVTASLVASRIVSMTFMPLLGYYVLKGQKGFEAGLTEGGRGATFARYYNGFSQWCLDHKAVSLGVCVLMLAGCTACLPLVGTAFFPRDRHSVFTVNMYLPEGSPIRQTAAEAQKVIARIDELEGREIAAYTTFVGAGGPRFWLSIVPEQRADNYAQILVHTTDREATTEIVERLKRRLPPECMARVTIEQLETGPPVGVPVQIRLFGDRIEELRRLADETKNLLRAIPGTDNIHDDWDPEVLQISLSIDPERANLTGITNQDVAMIAHTGFSGYSPTPLRERDRLVPITLRLRSDERTRYEDLVDLTAVSSITNERVPLNEIARFKTELVAPKICRRDHERCLTVKCDTVPGVLPSQVVAKMDRLLGQAHTTWPPNYRYEFGGEKYEQQKGFASLSRALLMSLVAIYLVLVWQFNSVTKPLVVFAAVPFGLAAGMMGLLVFGAPFGFMAFLGIASLAGVIVSHIIVLFDYIEDARERGMPLRRAVIDSALVRLRPVLVTVLATVGGLIPLALEGGPLWEPMCYVQIMGLLAATLVTKVVVPVLYVLFVEDLKIIRWETPEPELPPQAYVAMEAAAVAG